MTNHYYHNALHRAVLAQVDADKHQYIDSDCDTEHTLTFDTGSLLAYWHWEVTEGWLIVNEVVVTGNNLDLVIDNFTQYDNISSLIQHIVGIVNKNKVA